MAVNATCVWCQCNFRFAHQGAVPIKISTAKDQNPGTRHSRVFCFTKVKMTDNTTEIECGCDCDAIPDLDAEFAGELSPADFERLVKSKLQRAEQYVAIVNHWRRTTR